MSSVQDTYKTVYRCKTNTSSEYEYVVATDISEALWLLVRLNKTQASNLCFAIKSIEEVGFAVTEEYVEHRENNE
mgnify:CR=1 FL=1|jgi:hypothetical protein